MSSLVLELVRLHIKYQIVDNIIHVIFFLLYSAYLASQQCHLYSYRQFQRDKEKPEKLALTHSLVQKLIQIICEQYLNKLWIKDFSFNSNNSLEKPRLLTSACSVQNFKILGKINPQVHRLYKYSVRKVLL